MTNRSHTNSSQRISEAHPLLEGIASPRGRRFRHPLEGPKPIARPRPASYEAEDFRLWVETAGHKNNFGAPLSDKEAVSLLQEAVFITRDYLLANNSRSPMYRKRPLSAFAHDSTCGHCQALCAFALKMNGVSDEKLFPHQIARLLPSYTPLRAKHAFLVAELGNGKKYLIDASFRQFFLPVNPERYCVARIGAAARNNPEFAAAAFELIEHGFIELNDKVLQGYLHALSEETFTEKLPLESLQSPTETYDYSEEELWRDIRLAKQYAREHLSGYTAS